MPSAPIKPKQPSVMMLDIKPQRIKPVARNGRNSAMGEWKIDPNTTPMVPIITPMLIVSQKGPSAERLYR